MTNKIEIPKIPEDATLNFCVCYQRDVELMSSESGQAFYQCLCCKKHLIVYEDSQP